MKPIERIIEDYRLADAEKRLNLYLCSRDLRPYFEEIEHSELKISADAATSIHWWDGLMASLSTWCQNKATHGR